MKPIRQRNLFLCLLLGLFIYGCSAQLNTLIEVSREQESQKKYMEIQKRKYNLLLKHVKEGRIKKGLNKEEAFRLYGEPIAMKEIEQGSVFIYRDPSEFFPSQKVFLYFDEQGIFVNSEVVSTSFKTQPNQ
ncbi:MAG: hypothetical protein PHS93_02400 [Candidatus Omnitrophica bacterium]|nr:hypothetical protein [Candidatus Omnitrophota bacterium]MDD5352003.1 hypothetical protein [Candidatus Omnitrophota bacterium]MDD5551057.1 hypothetical protein [Candidatus Omnitrophota bacterium]